MKRIVARTEMDQRQVQKYGKHLYAIRYNLVNTEASDPMSLLYDFAAQVQVIAPYDDADYAWARIGYGIINYYKSGKRVAYSRYGTYDDMDEESTDWCQLVVDNALENLEELNKDVEPRIDHT